MRTHTMTARRRAARSAFLWAAFGPWLLVSGPIHADGEAPFFAVIQPGYPGSTEDARGFLRDLGAYLEKRTGLLALRGEYHSDSASALAALARERTAFAVVSLGFYLEHRADLGLLPLLEARPHDTFVIVAKPGDIDISRGVEGLAALKGEPVAGGPLAELELLRRIVLPPSAAVSSWKTTPTNRASRALRDLTGKGKYRAVVLTGRDYRAFQGVYGPKILEKAYESEYYPPAILVAVGARTGTRSSPSANEGHEDAGHAEQREEKSRQPPGKPGQAGQDGSGALPGGEAPGGGARAVDPRLAVARAWRLSKDELDKLVKAFAGFKDDPEGKGLLETMGAEGFAELGADGLKALEGTYDARKDGND